MNVVDDRQPSVQQEQALHHRPFGLVGACVGRPVVIGFVRACVRAYVRACVRAMPFVHLNLQILCFEKKIADS